MGTLGDTTAVGKGGREQDYRVPARSPARFPRSGVILVSLALD
jgi:hypothetical protein